MSEPLAGQALAMAAQLFVGTPFRLHGRDPATGLDCVGLVSASLSAINRPMALPTGYSLRSRDILPLLSQVWTGEAIEPSGPCQPGDVVLVRSGPCQFHLLIMAGLIGFTHAHAGLRRVVSCDGPMEWPIVRRWRLTEHT